MIDRPPRIIKDESSSLWGWVAGAVVIVLCAFALVGFLGKRDRTASMALGCQDGMVLVYIHGATFCAIAPTAREVLKGAAR